MIRIKEQVKFSEKVAFEHKCIVLLAGNDIACENSWYFSGNSVVLMRPTEIEHILYFELDPWVHYVPFEPEPEDILTKLQWVFDHPEKAKEIVQNALKRLEWFSGLEYQWACNEVMRRIS